MSKKSSKKINEKIKELETQIVELKSGWQRTQADFENFRNRTAQEKANLIKSANSNLMLEIVPVLDNFRRALEHKPSLLCHPEPKAKDLAERKLDSSSTTQNDNKKDLQEIKNYIQGLEHIKTQLEQILEQKGLTQIPAKPGDQFDPALHEAVYTEESDKYKYGQIISIIENGYKFDQKVLKPVKVKVGK